MFCFITRNWRGRPLTTYEVIVNLIATTTTKTGLTVRVESRCGAVVLGSAYRFPALSVAGVSLASPWLRFHIPLIKPGGPFSGTRLSDKALRHLLLHTFAHEQSALGPLKLV